MLSFFMMMNLLLSIMFMFLYHPLSLGLLLLLQTSLISLMTGMMNYNFWFSYILFLIMIGGMLILFIYMTSIASNEKFKFSYKIFSMFSFFMLIMILMTMMDFYYFNWIMKLYDFMEQEMNMNNKISMNKFLNWPMNLIMYMMIIYLLITLIIVIKMTNIKYGPLRQKN